MTASGPSINRSSDAPIGTGLQKVLSDYSRARNEEEFSAQNHVVRELARVGELLQQSPVVSAIPTIRVVASAGKGNWAKVPWIAFLDSRETSSTQHGAYCVLLFRQDLSGAYLALAQGVMEPITELGRRRGLAQLRERAQDLRGYCKGLQDRGFQLDDSIDLRADAGLGANYEASTAAYKLYNRESLPDDSALLGDLEGILSVYDRYLKKKNGARMDTPLDLVLKWSPKYEPRTIDLHRDIASKHGSVWWGRFSKPGTTGMGAKNLKLFRSQLESGAPTHVYLHGATATWETRLLDITLDREGVDENLVPEYYDSEAHQSLWVKLTDFRQVELSFLTNSFVRANGEPVTSGGLGNQSPMVIRRADAPTRGAAGAGADVLADVSIDFGAGLRAGNIDFGVRHDDVVRSFIAALATKQFVILTGLSGSGKTQLALKFGEWLGRGHYRVEPVRPDWTGSEALFGYEDALQPASDGKRPWHVPKALEFMLQAAHDPENPYLLILDEMNLAHVERYFADVLSGMESRQEVLPNLQLDPATGNWKLPSEGRAEIPVPRNLFVAGTVNIDETTYMFSPKVLDRANTFEFRVDTNSLMSDARAPSRIEASDKGLGRQFLAVAQNDDWHLENPAPDTEKFTENLRKLHGLLVEGGFEFGHRVFYEATRFSAMFSSAGSDDAIHTLDLQLMQKVLPRIHGSRRRLEPTLSALGRFCVDLKFEPGTVAGQSVDFDPVTQVDQSAQLPVSLSKVRRMMVDLRANQFASFTG